jgi:hypothetical protein
MVPVPVFGDTTWVAKLYETFKLAELVNKEMLVDVPAFTKRLIVPVPALLPVNSKIRSGAPLPITTFVAVFAPVGDAVSVVFAVNVTLLMPSQFAKSSLFTWVLERWGSRRIFGQLDPR